METGTQARGEAPEVLLREWREFVEECEGGYPWNVYEYHNDLAVRDRIENCLASYGPGFAAQVEELDGCFRVLLQPDVRVGPEGDPWWHRGVLRFAGPELAEGLRDWLGAQVEVR